MALSTPLTGSHDDAIFVLDDMADTLPKKPNQQSEPPNQELLHKSYVPEVGLVQFPDPFHDIQQQDDAEEEDCLKIYSD